MQYRRNIRQKRTLKNKITKIRDRKKHAIIQTISRHFSISKGKNNGTVKGIAYFKCKDKHGVFVRRDKIIYESSSSLTASPSSSSFTTSRSPKNVASSASPSNPKRRASPNLTKSSIRRSASSRKWFYVFLSFSLLPRLCIIIICYYYYYYYYYYY